MAAYHALPSLGFSRQEHWSGLPFPSPMHESEKWKWSHSAVSDSSPPHGPQPTRLLHPWDFPSKSTGVGCHCLLRFNLYFQANSWGSSNCHQKEELSSQNYGRTGKQERGKVARRSADPEGWGMGPLWPAQQSLGAWEKAQLSWGLEVLPPPPWQLATMGLLAKWVSLSSVRVCVTPWTVAHQAPLSMWFSRQEHWSGLPLPPPRYLPDPGIEPRSLALLVDSLPFESCDQQSTNPFRHFYPP